MAAGCGSNSLMGGLAGSAAEQRQQQQASDQRLAEILQERLAEQQRQQRLVEEKRQQERQQQLAEQQRQQQVRERQRQAYLAQQQAALQQASIPPQWLVLSIMAGASWSVGNQGTVCEYRWEILGERMARTCQNPGDTLVQAIVKDGNGTKTVDVITGKESCKGWMRPDRTYIAVCGNVEWAWRAVDGDTVVVRSRGEEWVYKRLRPGQERELAARRAQVMAENEAAVQRQILQAQQAQERRQSDSGAWLQGLSNGLSGLGGNSNPLDGAYERTQAQNARIAAAYQAQQQRQIAEQQRQQQFAQQQRQQQVAQHLAQQQRQQTVGQPATKSAPVSTSPPTTLAAAKEIKPEPRIIHFSEGVVVCPAGAQKGSHWCEGPFQTAYVTLGGKSEPGDLGNACGSSTGPIRDLGSYSGRRVFGCCFGINPTKNGSPNIDTAAKYSLIVPLRRTYRCQETQDGYCRGQ
jgi:hypothetical protein